MGPSPRGEANGAFIRPVGGQVELRTQTRKPCRRRAGRPPPLPAPPRAAPPRPAPGPAAGSAAAAALLPAPPGTGAGGVETRPVRRGQRVRGGGEGTERAGAHGPRAEGERRLRPGRAPGPRRRTGAAADTLTPGRCGPSCPSAVRDARVAQAHSLLRAPLR